MNTRVIAAAMTGSRLSPRMVLIAFIGLLAIAPMVLP